MLTKQVHSAVAADKVNRIAAYDLIRVFAAFSVIVIHVVNPIPLNFSSVNNYNWWVRPFYEAVFRSGIPLFIMLTGALLLPKATGVQFVKARVLRVLVPLCFWTLVYLVARNELKEITVSAYLNNLIHGSTFHFWYVYFILAVYIAMPLLYVLVHKIQVHTVKLFLLICLVTLTSYFINTDTTVGYLLNYSIYSLYLVFGYAISSSNKFGWLSSAKVGMFLFCIGTLITFIGSVYPTLNLTTEALFQSTSTHIFVKSVGAWIMLHSLASKISISWQKLLTNISKHSFAIYLMHTLVLEHILIARLAIDHSFLSPVLGVLISSLLTFIVSHLITFTLDKLPYGKYTH